LKAKVVSIVLILTMVLVVLGGCSSKTTEQPKSSGKVYQGLGQIPSFRVGPGKDANGVQVYSFTYVTAEALFDESGKIINVYFDSMEVSTPNYDGESMPHFSGWPAIQGYNVTDHASTKVSGVSTNTDESIAAEVNGWKSKRERGDKYGMNYNNDWYKQANFYQEFFKGKTVAELEAWFAKNCSDLNGRPLKADAKKDEDKAKYAKLTDAEKKALADVTAGATMSLKDAHGDLLGAVKKAYENRFEVAVSAK
jgi:hypothetical protein